MPTATVVAESRHRLLLSGFQRATSSDARMSSSSSTPSPVSHADGDYDDIEEKKQIDPRIGTELDELMKSFSDVVVDDDNENNGDEDDVSIARSVKQKLRRENRQSSGVKITAAASWSAGTPVFLKRVKGDGIVDAMSSVGSLSTATTEALTASSCGSSHHASTPLMMPRRLNWGGVSEDDDSGRSSSEMRKPLAEADDEDQDELNDVMGPLDPDEETETSIAEAVEVDGAVAPLSTPLVSLLDLSADTQTVGEEEEEDEEEELCEGKGGGNLMAESVLDMDGVDQRTLEESSRAAFGASSGEIQHFVPPVQSEDTNDGAASLDFESDRYQIPQERSQDDTVEEDNAARDVAPTASVADVVAEEVQVLAWEANADLKEEDDSEKENVRSPRTPPRKEHRRVASQGNKEETAPKGMVTFVSASGTRPPRPDLPKPPVSGSSVTMVSSTFTTPKLPTGWADSFMDKSTESIRNVTESIVESFCPAAGSVAEEPATGKKSLWQKNRKKRVASTSDIPLSPMDVPLPRGHPGRMESVDDSIGTPRTDNLSWDALSETDAAGTSTSFPPHSAARQLGDERSMRKESPRKTDDDVAVNTEVDPQAMKVTGESRGEDLTEEEIELTESPTSLPPLKAPMVIALDDDDDDDVCQPLAMVGLTCRTDPSYYLDYDVTGATTSCATQGRGKSRSKGSTGETVFSEGNDDEVRIEGNYLHTALKRRLTRKRIRNRAGESAKTRANRMRQLREIFLPPQPLASAVAKAHGKWWRKHHPDCPDICPSGMQADEFETTEDSFQKISGIGAEDDDSPPDEIRLSKSVDYHMYDPSSSRLLPQSPARRPLRKKRDFGGRWNGGKRKLLDEGDLFSGLFQCGVPQVTSANPSLSGSVYYEDQFLDTKSVVDDDLSTIVPHAAQTPERPNRASLHLSQARSAKTHRRAESSPKDYCYDSDPGEGVFRRADLLLQSMISGESVRAHAQEGVCESFTTGSSPDTSFVSHSSFVTLTLRELQKFDLEARNVIARRYVAETMNTTWDLTWHPTLDDMARQDMYRKAGMDDFLTPFGVEGSDSLAPPPRTTIQKPSAGVRHPPPIRIQLWLERGSRIRRQGAIEPKIMWRETVQRHLATRRLLNETTVKPYRISLFSVRRVRAVRRILDRARYPLANKAACFIVETFDREEFVFEARNTAERDDLVRSWKVLIWRLAEHVNAGDDDGIAEDYFVPLSFEPPDVPEERHFMCDMEEPEDTARGIGGVVADGR